MKRYFLPLLLATACVGGCASKVQAMEETVDVLSQKKQQPPLTKQELQKTLKQVRENPATKLTSFKGGPQQEVRTAWASFEESWNQHKKNSLNLEPYPETIEGALSKIEILNDECYFLQSLLCRYIGFTNLKEQVGMERFKEMFSTEQRIEIEETLTLKTLEEVLSDCIDYENARIKAFLQILSITGVNFQEWNLEDLKGITEIIFSFLQPLNNLYDENKILKPFWGKYLNPKEYEKKESYCELDRIYSQIKYHTSIKDIKESTSGSPEKILFIDETFFSEKNIDQNLKELLHTASVIDAEDRAFMINFLLNATRGTDKFLVVAHQLLQNPDLQQLTIKYIEQNPPSVPQSIERENKLFKYFATLLNKKDKDLKTFLLRKPLTVFDNPQIILEIFEMLGEPYEKTLAKLRAQILKKDFIVPELIINPEENQGKDPGDADGPDNLSIQPPSESNYSDYTNGTMLSKIEKIEPTLKSFANNNPNSNNVIVSAKQEEEYKKFEGKIIKNKAQEEKALKKIGEQEKNHAFRGGRNLAQEFIKNPKASRQDLQRLFQELQKLAPESGVEVNLPEKGKKTFAIKNRITGKLAEFDFNDDTENLTTDKKGTKPNKKKSTGPKNTGPKDDNGITSIHREHGIIYPSLPPQLKSRVNEMLKDAFNLVD